MDESHLSDKCLGTALFRNIWHITRFNLKGRCSGCGRSHAPPDALETWSSHSPHLELSQQAPKAARLHLFLDSCLGSGVLLYTRYGTVNNSIRAADI